MSMYMPAEDIARLADTFDTPPQEQPAQREQTDQIAEETLGIRRRIPLLVVGSVALSTAATAAAFAARRRVGRQRRVRWLAMNRRTSMVSPKVFVMLPLSAYVHVVNRNSPQRRFRLLRRRLAGMTRSREPFAKQLGQLGALRERVPVGRK